MLENKEMSNRRCHSQALHTVWFSGIFVVVGSFVSACGSNQGQISPPSLTPNTTTSPASSSSAVKPPSNSGAGSDSKSVPSTAQNTQPSPMCRAGYQLEPDWGCVADAATATSIAASANNTPANTQTGKGYLAIDDELKKTFDYDTGHQKYTNAEVVEVMKLYQGANAKAQAYATRLKETVSPDTSSLWRAITLARTGSLYDSMRMGLMDVKDEQLFNAKEKQLLVKMESSQNPDAAQKATEFKDSRRKLWQSARDKELDASDALMIAFYTEAVFLGIRQGARHPELKRAAERLIYYENIVGPSKMSSIIAQVKLEQVMYRPGMFKAAPSRLQ